MSAFVVGIELGNAALEEPDRPYELARLLRAAADAVEAGRERVELFDYNGNRVGRAGFIDEAGAVLELWQP